MKIYFKIAVISFFTLSISGLGCKNKSTEGITLKLDSVYLDTTKKAGMFKDIVVLSKEFDKTLNRIVKIKGIIEISEALDNSRKNIPILVEVNLKGEQKSVRIDTDRDSSLTDEAEYIIGKNEELIALPNMKISDGKNDRIMTLYVKPMQSGLFSPKDKYDISMIGFSFLAIRRAATVTFKNKYTVNVTNVSEGKYTSSGTYIYISEHPEPKGKPILYMVGDVIHIDRNMFKIGGIDSSGFTLELVKIGVDEKQFGILEGDYALPISGTDVLSGKEIKITDEPGKFTLLEFWGTWCARCMKLSDDVIKLSIEHRRNLKTIGIAADPSETKVKTYLKEKKTPYPNIYEKMDAAICSQYVVRDFPSFILIDSDGKIIFRGAGLDYFLDLKEIIKSKIVN